MRDPRDPSGSGRPGAPGDAPALPHHRLRDDVPHDDAQHDDALLDDDTPAHAFGSDIPAAPPLALLAPGATTRAVFQRPAPATDHAMAQVVRQSASHDATQSSLHAGSVQHAADGAAAPLSQRLSSGRPSSGDAPPAASTQTTDDPAAALRRAGSPAPTLRAQRPRAASRESAPSSAWGTWVDHHLYSLIASLGRMLGKPWATGLTVGVMAIALALPLGLWLVLGNVQRFSASVQGAREISVFLKADVDDARAHALAGTLRTRADVGQVTLRTPAQGLAQLREAGGLGEAIAAVNDDAAATANNPLPYLLIVTPTGDEMRLAGALEALPEADLVQHDAAWRARLDGWLAFGARVAAVLAVLLGAGALLVVGNTVRLDIQSRREEIAVLQLLGATDGFIRRPFLYLGAWYGVAAGTLSVALVAGAGAALEQPLTALAGRYGSQFALSGLPAVELIAVLLGAMLLGLLGAGLVTGHYLRQTRPTET